MFCKFCGALNEDGTNFCQACGKSLNEQAPHCCEPAYNQPLYSEPIKEKQPTNLLTMIFAILAVAAFSIYILLPLFNYRDLEWILFSDTTTSINSILTMLSLILLLVGGILRNKGRILIAVAAFIECAIIVILFARVLQYGHVLFNNYQLGLFLELAFALAGIGLIVRNRTLTLIGGIIGTVGITLASSLLCVVFQDFDYLTACGPVARMGFIFELLQYVFFGLAIALYKPAKK